MWTYPSTANARRLLVAVIIFWWVPLVAFSFAFISESSSLRHPKSRRRNTSCTRPSCRWWSLTMTSSPPEIASTGISTRPRRVCFAPSPTGCHLRTREHPSPRISPPSTTTWGTRRSGFFSPGKTQKKSYGKTSSILSVSKSFFF